MLLIHCPILQRNQEIRVNFPQLEKAFIARPESPEGISDEEWADYVFYRNKPQR